MTPRSFPLRVLAALLPLAFCAGVAGADTLLTLKSTTTGTPASAEPTTVEVWVGEKQISRSDERSTMIVRPDEMVVINHADKTYTVLELPIDFDQLVPPEQKQVAEMFKLTGKVTATDERKKVGEWNARRYDVELSNARGMAVDTVVWATKEIDIDHPTYQKLAAQTMATAGGADLVTEMAKIEGFPVLQETTFDMAGQTVSSREELVSVEEKDAPPGTYAVPEGYTESERLTSSAPR